MLVTVSKILSAVIIPQSHSSCQVLYGFWVQFKIYSNEQIFQKLTKFGWSSEIFWNRWKDLLGGCQRYSKMLGWSLLIFGRAVEISEDFTGRKKRKLQILKPHKRLKVHLLGIYFSRLKARILVEMMVNQYFYYHCVVHVIHWKGLCAKMNKKQHAEYTMARATRSMFTLTTGTGQENIHWNPVAQWGSIFQFSVAPTKISLALFCCTVFMMMSKSNHPKMGSLTSTLSVHVGINPPLVSQLCNFSCVLS